MVNQSCKAGENLLRKVTAFLLIALIGLYSHAEESQSLSPALIARICKEIREEKVTVLYAEPQYSRETAELIAREAGIAYSVLDPCASGPSDPEPGYYQKVMRKNLETLRGGTGK